MLNVYVATKLTQAPSAPSPDTGLDTGAVFKIVPLPGPETVPLAAAKDNSLFSENNNSNGAGTWLFAGRTAPQNNGAVRRALLAFDIDGNAYVAYQRRTGGYLRLASLDTDSGRWTRRTIDGGNGADVAWNLSLDVGEAALSDGFFTRYDTTVAVAYSDKTNGDLKYAVRGPCP